MRAFNDFQAQNPYACTWFSRSLIELYQEHALLLEQQLAAALHSGHILAERFEQLGRSPTEGAAAALNGPAHPFATSLSGSITGGLNDPHAGFGLDSALALQLKEQLKDHLKQQLKEQLSKELAGMQPETRGQLYAQQQQLQQQVQQRLQQHMQQQQLSPHQQRAAQSPREMEQQENGLR
jgi:hypothetical protein